MNATANGWVSDASQVGAEEWSQYLESNCDWSLDEFGGQYPWDAAVPAREDWDREVEEMNAHLATLAK